MVVAAAAEQLRVVVAAVAVAGALVLRRVRPAAVVVAPVALRVQLAVLLLHVLFAAEPSAVVAAAAAVAQGVSVRVEHYHYHAAVERVALVEQRVVTTFAPFAVHRVRDARLSSGTSVPSRDQARYPRADPSPDSDGIAVLLVLCS